MSHLRLHLLPTSLLTLLLTFAPLRTHASCYVAAYGVIGEQGWDACPGTAVSGGIETCCLPGSQCGEDSLCRVPASENPGTNAYYLAGCTDSTYSNSVCNKACVDFTTTYVQYEPASGVWMCCGDGGCNGTVTDATFAGVAPANWQVITGDSSTTPSTPTPTPSPTTPSTPNPPGEKTTSSVSSASSSSTTSAPLGPAGAVTTSISSADFKPTPLSSIQTSSTTSTAAAGSTATASTSNSASNNLHNPSSSSGLSTGAKAGIGVAIALGALAFGAAIVAIVMFRRRARRGVREMAVAEKSTLMAPGSAGSPPPPGYHDVAELSSAPASRREPEPWRPAARGEERHGRVEYLTELPSKMPVYELGA